MRNARALQERRSLTLTDSLLQTILNERVTILPEVSDTPSIYPNSPKVRLLAIGQDEDVADLIAELHQRGFAEIMEWTLPLQFADRCLELHLEPGEILRAHVWRRRRRS